MAAVRVRTLARARFDSAIQCLSSAWRIHLMPRCSSFSMNSGSVPISHSHLLLLFFALKPFDAMVSVLPSSDNSNCPWNNMLLPCGRAFGRLLKWFPISLRIRMWSHAEKFSNTHCSLEWSYLSHSSVQSWTVGLKLWRTLWKKKRGFMLLSKVFSTRVKQTR